MVVLDDGIGMVYKIDGRLYGYNTIYVLYGLHIVVTDGNAYGDAHGMHYPCMCCICTSSGIWTRMGELSSSRPKTRVYVILVSCM